MPLFTGNPYKSGKDLQTLIDLVSQRSPERITDYPSIIDLQEILGIPETEDRIAIWRDTNKAPVGFTLLDGNTLRFDLIPTAENSGLASQMVDWAIAHLQPQAKVNLRTSCLDDNAVRLALLNQLGFVLEPGFTWRYTRSLAKPIPKPYLPDGFTIRPIAGEEEVEAHVELHRAAFGTKNMTVEHRLSMMKTPDYLPELDLVAIAPNGQLVAYTMGQIIEQENILSGRKEGYTDPVATHPDYQDQGLAKALLLTALRKLQKRGIETASLGTWYKNIAMQQTAATAGFEKAGRTLFFEKSLR